MRGDKTSRGSPAPGPTGLTWALERSEQRHAQGGAPSQEQVGTDSKTFFFRLVSLLLFNLAGFSEPFQLFLYDVSEVGGLGLFCTWVCDHVSFLDCEVPFAVSDLLRDVMPHTAGNYTRAQVQDNVEFWNELQWKQR